MMRCAKDFPEWQFLQQVCKKKMWMKIGRKKTAKKRKMFKERTNEVAKMTLASS